MGMGGVFSAIPTAEFSFFGNPASFAAKKASYTLVSADVWAYVKPTSDNISTLMNLPTLISEKDYSAIYDLVPSNGGIGAGTSVSASAFAGKGFGIGAFLTTDNWAQGKTVPSVLDTETELSAVIGLGVPITLGNLRLSVGGDLRPFYRVHGDSIDMATVISYATDKNDDGTSNESTDPLAAVRYLYSGFGSRLGPWRDPRARLFGLGPLDQGYFSLLSRLQR